MGPGRYFTRDPEITRNPNAGWGLTAPVLPAHPGGGSLQAVTQQEEPETLHVEPALG